MEESLGNTLIVREESPGFRRRKMSLFFSLLSSLCPVLLRYFFLLWPTHPLPHAVICLLLPRCFFQHASLFLDRDLQGWWGGSVTGWRVGCSPAKRKYGKRWKQKWLSAPIDVSNGTTAGRRDASFPPQSFGSNGQSHLSRGQWPAGQAQPVHLFSDTEKTSCWLP